jgi:Putative DNA-binding domain
MASKKGIKEHFARFFEQPSREALRDLLRQHVGESEFLDFKEEWPKHSHLAKQILGFANTGDACIVVGVREEDDKTLTPIGLPSITDTVNLMGGLKSHLPQNLLDRLDFLDFSFQESEYPILRGKLFQVLLITYDVDHTPTLALKEGEGLKNTVVYVRRPGGVAEATHEELQKVINKRIETRYSTSKELDLKRHLEQLRILIGELRRSPLARMLSTWMNSDGGEMDEFLNHTINLKKMIIQTTVGATPEVVRAFNVLNPPKTRVARAVTPSTPSTP